MLLTQHQKADRRYQTAAADMQTPGLRRLSKLQHFTSLFNIKTLLVILLLPAVATPRSIPSSLSSRSVGLLAALHSSIPEQSATAHQTSTSEEGQELLRRKRTATTTTAAALKDDPTLWPDQRVPFVFVDPFPRRYKNQVMKAIGVWHKRTCIRFVDRTDEEYYIRFEMSTLGCTSRVGMKTGRRYRNQGQPVSLTVACLQKRGQIMHELGHVIGFYHEHQRPDRDNYIQILPGNILPGQEDQFEKLNFTTYGDYDLNSLMQYSLIAYARPNATNGTMAVLPNVTLPEDVEIGHLHTLSVGDYTKAKKMYQCPKRKPEPVPESVPDISGDNIYGGEHVALMVSGTNFPTNSWLSCTGRQCSINSCVGRNFRPDDLGHCPDNIFYLHKVQPGGRARASGVVRVGDSIVLERVVGYAPNAVSSYIFCNEDTLVCSLSDICLTGTHSYNTTSFCRQHVLIVKAEGKRDGDAITHQDLIGFEFATVHDEFFEQQCAFGCDPTTRICSKKLCVFSSSNSLLGGGPTQAAAERICRKDMFFIQKY